MTEEAALSTDADLVAAATVVISAQFGSVNLLQRRLRIGRDRAARLMDMLEENGVVGPVDGTRARDVLVTPDQLDTVKAQLGAVDQ